MRTEFANQSLRNDQMKTACNRPERHTQIRKADDRSDIVIAVQGRNDQVPGLCRMRCDLRGFLITNLADADHIGILPQSIAEQRSERDSGFDIDFHLAYMRNHPFDRVFDGYHVFHGIVDGAQHRIQGRGFAAASRPAYQDHARRQLNSVSNDGELFRGQPDVFQIPVAVFR